LPASVALLLIAVVLAAAACINFGGSADPETGAPEKQPVEGLPPEFDKLSEVYDLLESEHVDAGIIDPSALADGAIRGMLEAMEDEHAAYLDPEQYSFQRQEIQGTFEGIGAEVTVRNGLITIVAPIPDTPAEEAGVKPGDVILSIDGESIAGWDLWQAINRIRGEKGTIVRVEVRRDRTGETEVLEITRGVIQLQSVRLTMLVGRIGHLRITSFAGTTLEELERELERFERSKGLGLIVDVRNNPGGLLSSVVNITSQFVDEGLVLYQLDGRGKRRDWDATSGGLVLDVPAVILMNEFSASASEVFAGAIMFHQRATTIGATTFGKGSVNNLWPLSDGSAVNFTVGRWYTPDGKMIEGDGIVPDIVLVATEDEAEDVQLDLAIDELTKLIERSQAAVVN
jgi:carboxyl-terminal processing protease